MSKVASQFKPVHKIIVNNGTGTHINTKTNSMDWNPREADSRSDVKEFPDFYGVQVNVLHKNFLTGNNSGLLSQCACNAILCIQMLKAHKH
jgi:hypothetical protein